MTLPWQLTRWFHWTTYQWFALKVFHKLWIWRSAAIEEMEEFNKAKTERKAK